MRRVTQTIDQKIDASLDPFDFVVVGGDPGKGGAMVAMDYKGNVVWGMRNNAPIEEIWHCTWPQFLLCHIPVFGIMEEVHGRPPMRNGRPVAAGHSSQFTFGVYKGIMLSMFAAGQFPFDIRPPMWWMKEVGMPKTGGDKKINKEFAIQLMEGRDLTGITGKIVHANADAILLAECARKIALKDRLFPFNKNGVYQGKTPRVDSEKVPRTYAEWIRPEDNEKFIKRRHRLRQSRKRRNENKSKKTEST